MDVREMRSARDAASTGFVCSEPGGGSQAELVGNDNFLFLGGSYESPQFSPIDRRNLRWFGSHKIIIGLRRRAALGRRVAHLRGHHEGRSTQAKWSDAYLAAGGADS